MKSIIIKEVILVHNEGTFSIEAKVTDGFVYLLKVFLEGVDVTVHSTSVLKRKFSYFFIRPI